jgi:hypothetical protein
MPKKELFLELMSELTKKNCQSKKIKQLCDLINMPFNGDILELMTYILGSDCISRQAFQQKTQAKKTSHDINL